MTATDLKHSPGTKWEAVIHQAVPGGPLERRISLHRESADGSRKFHLGLTINRYLSVPGETIPFGLLDELRALCDALDALDCYAGHEWSGSDLLQFPDHDFTEHG